jgi:AcrR family transcriptional regulator
MMSRRKDIIAAALKCFVEHGVEATSIEMICTAADVSVGNIYHHFGKKEGLVAEVYIAGLRDFQRSLITALQPVTEVRLAVRTLVYANIDWIVAHPTWANFIFHHGRALQHAERQQAFSDEAQLANNAVWARLQTLDGVAEMEPLPLEVYHALLIAPVHEYAKRWLDGRCQTPLADLREVFADAAWAVVRKR